MEIIRGENIEKSVGITATIGMFDGVHIGHQTLLASLREESQRRGTKSAVVTFSQHPQRVLRPECGLKMLMTLEERLRALEKQGVDVVILLDFTPELSRLDSLDFLRVLKSDYGVETLLMGFNHRFGCARDEYFEDYVAHGKSIGVEVVRAVEYQGEFSPVSSSLIRKVLEEGRVDLAKNYLSRPFELSGEVVHGFKNGRKLGYPTANIDITSELILPHKGVYTVIAELEDGNRYGGMANIGVRPTVVKGGNQTFEVNIFDFEGDLYGQVLKVQFVKFMRSEMKMNSLEELKQQLARDAQSCRKVLERI